jgi:acyl-CoA hydrolase
MTSEPGERRMPWGLWYRPPEITDWDLTPRACSSSAVTLSEQIDLTGANLLGNVHGGTVMKLCDTAGGLAAMKHCGGPVVTAVMDEMTFLEPIFVGEVVIVKAMVNDTGRTSLEVGVRVEADNLRTGRLVHTASAYLVYVALDRDGRPRPVPPVLAEDDEQVQRQHEAKLRREARLRRKEAILAARRAKGE